jgi:hypothetical protein
MNLERAAEVIRLILSDWSEDLRQVLEKHDYIGKPQTRIDPD